MSFVLWSGSSDPRVCPKGHYCPEKTKNYADHPCPAGRFTEETGASAVESCKTCPEGYYCGSGTDTPSPCLQGTFNPNVGQDAVGDCTACTAGFACTQLGLTEPDSPCYPGYGLQAPENDKPLRLRIACCFF